MKKFKKIRTKRTYRFGHYYRVEVDEVLTPGGHKGEYNVLRMPPYALIIPIDPEGNVYLVRQHRYPAGRLTLELPMGNSEKGEDSLSAAKRELLEETGMESGSWKSIGSINEANGFSDIAGIVFVANNAAVVSRPIEMDDESISEVVKCTVSEVVAQIAAGEIADAATISAFSKAFFLGMLG